MNRKPRVDRSPEEKWQIVQEGIKSGNVSETCRRHGITPSLFYRWRDEAEQGAKAALGGRSAAAAECNPCAFLPKIRLRPIFDVSDFPILLGFQVSTNRTIDSISVRFYHSLWDF